MSNPRLGYERKPELQKRTAAWRRMQLAETERRKAPPDVHYTDGDVLEALGVAPTASFGDARTLNKFLDNYYATSYWR